MAAAREGEDAAALRAIMFQELSVLPNATGPSSRPARVLSPACGSCCAGVAGRVSFWQDFFRSPA